MVRSAATEGGDAATKAALPYSELVGRTPAARSTAEVFITADLAPGGRPLPKAEFDRILRNPESWHPERAALHDRLLNEAYEDASQLSERLTRQNGGQPIIIVTRGNSGSGKSTLLRGSGNVDELRHLGIPDAQGRVTGVVNPDEFKASLLDSGPSGQRLTHTQVHSEGSSLSSRLSQRLFGENKSFVLDKRFALASEIQEEVIKPARERGYKVVVIDVDAELATSAQRVAGRPIGGTDPNVKFDVIQNGFTAIRENRGEVASLPGIDEYFLLKSDAPGGSELVFSRTGNGARVHDEGLWSATREAGDTGEAVNRWADVLDRRAAGEDVRITQGKD